MEADRLARVAASLAAGGDGALERLLGVCAAEFVLTGATLAIVRDGEHLGSMAVSAPSVAALDELQFALGEGPCLDADRSGQPVLEADLDDPGSAWPAFGPAASERGCRAVFSFPLRIGAVRMGVLSLYRSVTGELDGSDAGDAVSIARIMTHLLLGVVDGLAPDVVPEQLDQVLHHRRHVHQATGMIAAQLDVDVSHALARLRAFAWTRELTIDEVARAVVGGDIRFGPAPA